MLTATSPVDAPFTRHRFAGTSPRNHTGVRRNRNNISWLFLARRLRRVTKPAPTRRGTPIAMRDVGQILVGASPRHSAMLPQRADGNLDVWDLSAGTILYLPVEVAGGLPPMATRMRRKVVASWRAGGMICPQWTLTSYAACARMS